MTIEVIRKEVKRIRARYGEPDLFKLCQAMGIILLQRPMGTYEGCCKGFFLVQSRIPAIMLNSDLPEPLQQVILAHEIGHAILHRKVSGVRAFHDFKLFDKASQYEYEANLFASEYLIHDTEVIDSLKEGLSFFDVARHLMVPEKLLDFKLRILRQHRCTDIDPPLMASSDFLKRVSCEEDCIADPIMADSL